MSDPAGRADEAAVSAGLRYVSAAAPGLGRKRAGRGFRYLDREGRPISDAATLYRIRRLAIPPAWNEVWICPDQHGHLQALGTDAKGRTQYLYHPEFRAIREHAKFDHMLTFANALPEIRKRVAVDMAKPGLSQDKVLATVVHLLESTMIRVGNRDYADANGSFGLTTLRNRHINLIGSEVRFRFKGKSGRVWRISVRDRRAARVVRALQELPGQLLFQYSDDDGDLRAVTSAEVNAYLRAISGVDITAKDFRTWTGTVLAAAALLDRSETEESPSKSGLAGVIAEVASSLGNTPAICRKCYVHPDVIGAYFAGDLKHRIKRGGHRDGLSSQETAVLLFLRRNAKASAKGAGRVRSGGGA